MFEEGHKLAQRFEERVRVGAGVSPEVRPFFGWQIVEAGAMVAKEHQNVVKALVVLQVTETRARPGVLSLERDAAN